MFNKFTWNISNVLKCFPGFHRTIIQTEKCISTLKVVFDFISFIIPAYCTCDIEKRIQFSATFLKLQFKIFFHRKPLIPTYYRKLSEKQIKALGEYFHKVVKHDVCPSKIMSLIMLRAISFVVMETIFMCWHIWLVQSISDIAFHT